MTQQTTPATTGSVRPGKTDGQASEFTIMVPLKPGGAEMVRERLEVSGRNPASRDLIGTLHDMRTIIIDNDTRMLFTFLPVLSHYEPPTHYGITRC